METYSYGQVECPESPPEIFRVNTFSRAIHVGGSDDFNVVFIGAGNIMFGTPFEFLMHLIL